MSESAASCLEDLNGIRTYLTTVQDTLKSGSMPDIASLEKRVNDVCLRIQQVDEAGQKQCLPQLSSMLNMLDECERALRDWHAEAVKKAGNAP